MAARKKTRRRKPFTAGQCLDIVAGALRRYWRENPTTREDVCAVLDAALRMQGILPTELRVKPGTEWVKGS